MPHDLIILGSGPAGYVAAERAGHAGKSVLLIEKEPVLGGVCLNWGCIPTKTLLACAKTYAAAKHGESFGVKAPGITFDLGLAMARKKKVVTGLNQGIAGLMKKSKVEVVRGQAKILSAGKVEVDGKVYEAKDILVCTGSKPAKPPIPGADLPHVLDSTGILDVKALPQRLTVIGGGVIGLEFACFFAKVGVPVTVIEMLPGIAGATDAEITAVLKPELEKLGITFHLGAKVTKITAQAVEFSDAKGQAQSSPADMVLLSTGRIPVTEGFGLAEAGVLLDRRAIVIDERCRTNIPGIWAAGDCTGKILLAHVAYRQAECAVTNICGGTDRMRYHAIPGVIYTSPEVATVGLTEAEAKAKDIPVKIAKLPMAVSGRFLAENDGRGLVKVLVHAQTRALVGCHIIGGAAGEMIWGAAAAIETELRIDELTQTIFPHPTVSEVIREALLTIH